MVGKIDSCMYLIMNTIFEDQVRLSCESITPFTGPESVPDVYRIEQHWLIATLRRRSNNLCSGKSIPISSSWSHVIMCF